MRIRQFFFAAIVFLVPSLASAWSDTGHHVVGVLAFEQLEQSEQVEVMRILAAHPDFGRMFDPPANIQQKPAIDRWRIGLAACWPDAIRDSDADRPSWHYAEGATAVIGNVDYPKDGPATAAPGVTMNTQKINVLEAIDLCRRVYHDRTQSDPQRAVALCWLCHMVGDIHQPCHAGSVYAPCFDYGDRGANRIELVGGGNVHGAWDRLLGGQATANDVRQRVFELRNEKPYQPDRLDPVAWRNESVEAAKRFVYSPEVGQPIIAASRGLTPKLPALKLSDEYFTTAGEVARARVVTAGYRLAGILTESSQSGK